jgi:hypothetical protein
VKLKFNEGEPPYLEYNDYDGDYFLVQCQGWSKSGIIVATYHQENKMWETDNGNIITEHVTGWIKINNI